METVEKVDYIQMPVQASVIIPLYNEEKAVDTLLSSIKQTLTSVQSYEVILVDDGSHDNTLKLLSEHEKKDTRIRVFANVKNRGKGYAIKVGVLQSQYPTVVIVDGDLDIAPTSIMDYIIACNSRSEDELFIASKMHPFSNVNMSLSRLLLSRLFNLIVRIMVGIKIKDTQMGLKAGE